MCPETRPLWYNFPLAPLSLPACVKFNDLRPEHELFGSDASQPALRASSCGPSAVRDSFESQRACLGMFSWIGWISKLFILRCYPTQAASCRHTVVRAVWDCSPANRHVPQAAGAPFLPSMHIPLQARKTCCRMCVLTYLLTACKAQATRVAFHLDQHRRPHQGWQ